MPQCLKLVFPAQGTLSGVIDHGEHLPAAVLQYSQNGIVGLLGHLPVPAGGDKGGINVDGQVVGGQAAAEPPFDVITAAASKMRHLLLAVGTAIDTVRNLAYLLSGKPLGVEKVEQSGTLLAFVAYQPQENGIEVPAAAARNTERELKAMTVPATGTETVSLLVGILADEQLTFMKHQRVHD